MADNPCDGHGVGAVDLKEATWVRCECCGEFWCNEHGKHAFACECPPIEELTFDPYSPREEAVDGQ